MRVDEKARLPSDMHPSDLGDLLGDEGKKSEVRYFYTCQGFNGCYECGLMTSKAGRVAGIASSATYALRSTISLTVGSRTNLRGQTLEGRVL